MNKTNEEIYIESRMGRENPFRVPEGYFDRFADEFLQKLPEVSMSDNKEEKKKPSWVVRLRPLLYAAACVCLVVFSVTIYFTQRPSETGSADQVAVVKDAGLSDSYFEEAADYVMVDNHDIYACLMNE